MSHPHTKTPERSQVFRPCIWMTLHLCFLPSPPQCWNYRCTNYHAIFCFVFKTGSHYIGWNPHRPALCISSSRFKSHVLKCYLLTLHICMLVNTCECPFSFSYHMDSGTLTPMVREGHKHPYPLIHLASPIDFLIFSQCWYLFYLPDPCQTCVNSLCESHLQILYGSIVT